MLALRDKTVPSVIVALDRTFRIVGGAPTYVLTDNEKTVTVDHIAGVPVRNAAAVSFGRHYGVSVLTCQPADPASKGGAEASVKVAKADLVPTDTNLLPGYGSFAEVESACAAFMDLVNTRPHRVTRRAPVEMLAEERVRLHRVPDDPHTVVFGLARRVPPNTPMVSFEHGQYSVLQHLRHLLGTVINALLSVEADAVCSAEFGMPSPDRVRAAERLPGTGLDTRPGTIDRTGDLGEHFDTRGFPGL